MAITIDQMIAELKAAKEEHGGDMELAWDQYGQNGWCSPVLGVTNTIVTFDDDGKRYLLIDIDDESFEYTEEG